MRIPWRSLLIISLGLLAVSSARAVSSVGRYKWTNFVGHPGGLGHADATGTNAQFVYPQGVATDSSGNIYVADTGNQIIRKITPTGVVSTIAGTAGLSGASDGTGANARFKSPTGVAVDKGGIVFVADTGNNTIREISPAGVVSTLAGSPGVTGTANGSGSLGLFHSPSALALDAAGAVYVADTGNDTIRKVTFKGEVSTVAGSAGVSGTANGTGNAARFDHPSGIALDKKRARFLIADTDNDTIRVLTAAGVVKTFSGTPGVSGTADGGPLFALFNKPVGIAVDTKDNIFVADSGNDAIRLLYGNGVALDYAVHGHFNDPTGLAVNATGTLYVADTKSSTILAVDKGVTILAGSRTIPGTSNGTGDSAGFDYPCAVALDGKGDVYIADTFNDTIRVATGGGAVSTLAGAPRVSGTANGSGSTARFFHPAGIVLDGGGNTYVADTDNDTIRKISRNGVVSTFAGTPGVSGTSNGRGTVALFNHPRGMGIDLSGTLYVADTGNDTIRAISSGGVVSTLAGTPLLSGTKNGPGAGASFDGPEGLVVDGTSGVFVADTRNHAIRRILFDGTVSTYSGRPGHRGSANGNDAATFDLPAGIAADNHHHLYVADRGNDTIREIDPKERSLSPTVTTIGGVAGLLGSASGMGSAANFAMPHGIVSTNIGELYVADSLNNRIARGVTGVGSLRVVITPPGAVNAGAQWSIDGGKVYHDSRTTVGGLTPGTDNYIVTFKPISGFSTPANQTVSISAFTTTVITATYVRVYGSVSVTITPQIAIDDGAEWKLADGSYQQSGNVISNVSAGNHTIVFSAIPDYNTPASQAIVVAANQTTETTGTYTLQTGSLEVTLAPAGVAAAGGEWYVDNGPLETSGTTVSGLTTGKHTVTFTAATNYITPDPESVTIVNKATTEITGTYGGIPIISVQQPVGTPLQSGVSTVNFGPVVSGSTAPLQFAIVDVGTGPLTILSLSIQGPDADRFAATALTSASIAMGGTSTFVVNCTPVGFGAISAGLTIDSNASAIPSFTVGLAASGTNGPVTLKSAAGSFAGLISGSDDSVRGFTGFTLSAKGALTGKFILDGASLPVKGSFATDGAYTGTPSNVNMVLTGGSGGPLNPAGYQIVATANDSEGAAPFIAYHAAYTATQTVAESPRYTLIMDGTDTAATIPQGSSYATLTLPRKGGSALLSGKLADGTPFTYATFVASGPDGHQILIFDSTLYKSKGLVAGPVTFEQLTDSDCDGILQWIKPAGASRTSYPLGFNTLLDLGGAKYIQPVRNNPPIPISTGTFTLSDGTLAAPDSEQVVLTTHDTLIFTGPNPNKIKVTINGTAGSFSGSFIDPMSNTSVPFSGLLYQNAATPGAEGFFLGPVTNGTTARGVPILSGTTVSGDVTLLPPR